MIALLGDFVANDGAGEVEDALASHKQLVVTSQRIVYGICWALLIIDSERENAVRKVDRDGVDVVGGTLLDPRHFKIYMYAHSNTYRVYSEHRRCSQREPSEAGFGSQDRGAE